MWFSFSSRRRVMTACSFLFFLGMFAPLLRAQLLQGTLNGNVTDPSQAAMAGAAVTVTDQATSFSRSVVSSASGLYTLSGLPPGVYDVTVSAQGFQTAKYTGISITAQTVSRLDVTLTVGSVSESVTVSAHAAELQA